MSDDTPHHLGPHEALELLGPAHPLIYRSLEYAVSRAAAYFEAHLPVDPYLFSGLVRYHNRLVLARRSPSIEGFEVIRLRNIGTRLKFGGLTIRLWKATGDGYLPPPGNSGSKADYYDQPYLPGLEQPIGTRLAVLWEADQSLALTEVNLVCPKGTTKPWVHGEEHWRIAIPHPAEAEFADVRFEVDAEEIDLELALDQTAETDDDEW